MSESRKYGSKGRMSSCLTQRRNFGGASLIGHAIKARDR
jgi:hypothetical protein